MYFLSIINYNCRLVHRFKVVQELLKTEETYVNTLAKTSSVFKMLLLFLTLKVFVTPLRKSLESGKPLISADDVFVLFAQLEEILCFNKKVLALIQEKVSKWHIGSLIGDLFITKIVYYVP